MKIQFPDDFKGPQLEAQIGDKHFKFSNGGTPFEVDDDVARHLIGLGYFVACAPENKAVPTAELPKQTEPRKG